MMAQLVFILLKMVKFRLILLTSLWIFLGSLIYTHVSYAHSQSQVIEMTADGFIPADATVDTNSTVIFLNKDNVSHWPASNPHPTHDLYPEFDSKLSIESGKSWAFKPTKIGNWKYHDHLNPHMGGTLKVIGEASNEDTSSKSQTNIISKWVENLKNAFLSAFSRFKNTSKPIAVLDKDKFIKSSASDQIVMLKKYADSNGAEKTWEFIKDTYKGQSGTSGNIHDLAHLVGGMLYEKLDFAGIVKCTPEFAFGCFHGFLDKAFAKNLDHLNDAQEACLKLAPDGSGPAASCIHGIGHGVASFHATKDLKDSLSDCRKLLEGKEYCYDGVFMEFSRSASESFYKGDNPLYPCDDLENKFGYAYSFSCGRNQPTMLMGRFKLGYDDVVKICLDSKSKPFKEACFDSLGFSLASNPDPDLIIQNCQKIKEEEYAVRCTKSVAGELIFQDVPNWQQISPQICGSLSKDYASDCNLYLDQLKTQYGKK